MPETQFSPDPSGRFRCTSCGFTWAAPDDRGDPACHKCGDHALWEDSALRRAVEFLNAQLWSGDQPYAGWEADAQALAVLLRSTGITPNNSRTYPCGAVASGIPYLPVDCPAHGKSCPAPLPAHEINVPRFVTGLNVHGPVVADPLPAHDAPQVERFEVVTVTPRGQRGAYGSMRADLNGGYVRYTDYATLEAEKQQLEAENRELKATNKRLNRRAQSAEAAADAKAEDWNKRAAGSQLRNHYYIRMRDAESSLATLREAVREKYKAEAAKKSAIGQFKDNNLSYPEQLEDAEHAAEEADAKLRALVTPQGET